MDLDQLRLFHEVASGATVTDTARRAHHSQPALSRALGRLEAEVGGALFDRTGRNLRITPEGRVLQAAAERALGELDHAVALIRQAQDPERGVVRLGFLSSLGPWLVPALLRTYKTAHPAVSFALRHDGAGRIVPALQAGELDLVVTADETVPAGASFQHLLDERLELHVPADHRLAGAGAVALTDVRHEPFVTLQRGYHLRQATEDLCARSGFIPELAFEAQDIATAEGLVAAGLGVGLLPVGPASRSSPGTVRLGVTEPDCSRPVGLAWMENRPRSGAADAFLAYARTFPSDGTPGAAGTGTAGPA